MRRPIDYEGFLDRQRVDGDRTNDKISELTTQLNAAHFEISNTKAEVNRKLQEISDSHGANRRSFEREMANLSGGLQTCQTDLHKFREEAARTLESKLQVLDEQLKSKLDSSHLQEVLADVQKHMEAKLQDIEGQVRDKLDTSHLQKVVSDAQTRRSDRTLDACQPDNLTAIISHSEGLTAEILDMKRRLTETLAESKDIKAEAFKYLTEVKAIDARINAIREQASLKAQEVTKEDQPAKPKRGRPAQGDKIKQALTLGSSKVTKESKSVSQRAGGLDKWLGEPRNSFSKKDQVNEKTQNYQKPTTTLESKGPVKSSSCNCVELGCETCVNHDKRIEKLESELSALKMRHEDLKRLIPDKEELLKYVRDGSEILTATQASKASPQLPKKLTEAKPLLQAGSPKVQNEKRKNSYKNVTSKPKAKIVSEDPKTTPSSTKSKSGARTVIRGIERFELSSTCYLNAAVQALFSIQELSSFLANN